MVDKGSHGVRIAEINWDSNGRVGECMAVVIRYVDGVAEEAFMDWFAEVIEQQEVQLMNMECVELIGTVFDDPVLNGSLQGDDIRDAGAHVEHLGFFSVYGQIKLHRAGGVVRHGQFFGEEKTTYSDRSN